MDVVKRASRTGKIRTMAEKLPHNRPEMLVPIRNKDRFSRHHNGGYSNRRNGCQTRRRDGRQDSIVTTHEPSGGRRLSRLFGMSGTVMVITQEMQKQLIYLVEKRSAQPAVIHLIPEQKAAQPVYGRAYAAQFAQ